MDSWGLRYGELVERRGDRQPDRAAIISEGSRLSYGDLATHIRQFAALLHNQGVTHGDRVLCVSENRPEMLIAAYACSRVGAVFVPVNAASVVDELAFVLGDATPSVILAGTDANTLRSGSLPDLPPVIEFDGWTSEPAGTPLQSAAVGADDVALICYTSGTTGKPKGVALTHGALHWNSFNTQLGLDFASDDVALVNTPLFHTAALNMLAVNTLYKGGTLVVQRKFDPRESLALIAKEHVTIMFAVPTVLTLLERSPEFDKAATGTLRWILSGGAPLPADVAARWTALGIPVINSFGLSEAGSVTFRRRDEVSRKAASSGASALLTEVRIVDDSGRPVPTDMPGEIVVTGPNVATGYWNRPDATRDTFRPDGLWTGDRGYLDADGDLVIVGRSKDIIITGGENVDPVEVEQAILRHPAVADAAVVGTPDPLWGELVTLVVVPAPGETLQLDEARAYLAEHLAKYKLPRRIAAWDSLPKSPIGKVRRNEIQAALSST